MEQKKYHVVCTKWSNRLQRNEEVLLTVTYDITPEGEQQNLVISDSDGDPIITSPWPEVEGQLLYSNGFYAHNYYKPEDIDEAVYQTEYWNSLWKNPENERFSRGYADTPEEITLELCDVVAGPYENDYRVVDFYGDEI